MIRRLGGVRRDRSERGAITIVAAAFLTVLVFAAALSVDIGGRVQEIRRAQATADLAALDASRDLSSDAATQDLAWRSALRNKVDHTKPGYAVTATRGTVSNGTFTATGSYPTSVQVRVTTPYHDFFGGTSASLSATGVATNTGLAQFVIGATLVTINAGLGPFGSVSLGLVGYNGLASGNVTLGALATQLGFSALTPDQVLASQVSVGQLATASSNLLAASDPGASANLSALGATLLSQAYNNNNKIPLGDALGLKQGTGVGLGASVNLLQVVSGSIQLANQKAGINLNLNLNPNPAESISYLESLPLRKQSAVLTEKLADLYWANKKLSDALDTYAQVLKLNPSTQQRIRVLLTLASRRELYGPDSVAFDVYQQFLKENPTYPDLLGIYNKLLPLAKRLDRKNEVERIEQEIKRLTPAAKS